MLNYKRGLTILLLRISNIKSDNEIINKKDYKINKVFNKIDRLCFKNKIYIRYGLYNFDIKKEFKEFKI